MPCSSPLHGFRSRVPSESGRFPVVFAGKAANLDSPVTLPCGRCVDCRLEASRQKAIRCVHEASLYDDNCFLTLTYDDEHLPLNNSLRLKDMQDFWKRYRDRIKPRKIRTAYCGEYGDKNGRPHYHALVFNHDFEDKKYHCKSPSGDRLYTSELLSSLWPAGHALIGDVNFNSAAYVCRYIMKKALGFTGRKYLLDEQHQMSILNLDYAYIRFINPDPLSPEFSYYHISPEFMHMSKGQGGIGKPWLRKYGSDVFPSDFVIINGKKVKPPKYYDRVLLDDNENIFGFDFDTLSGIFQKRNDYKRELLALSDKDRQYRSVARRKITESKLSILPRKL